MAAALWSATAGHAWWPMAQTHTINYTSVPGVFLQDDPKTNNTGFDYTNVNFGLINRTYPTDAAFDPHGQKSQWQRFEAYVDQLNRDAGHSVRYKVLFMGRHGEGYHNVAESYYGTPAWNCYWAELDGNGTSVWADAHLTDNGAAQALKANSFWRSRLEEQHMPAPESYYTSPLTRCTQTANLTFSGLDLPCDRPFIPTVKELLREDISIHTCDRRSSKTYIHDMFPTFRFEEGFAEDDPLWRGTEGETDAAQTARSKVVLDDIFRSDKATWLSITSHSGEISHLLIVLNHIPFSLSTGQVIPVLVRAEVETTCKVPPTTTAASFTAEKTCGSPPVTSLATGGCVCASATGMVTSTAKP